MIFLITILQGCITDVNVNDNREEKNTIIYGTMDLDSIYPFSLKNNNRIVLFSNIFEGLVEFNEFFQIDPALATEWINIDDYNWRFFLRQNVTFHNGNIFTSHDVNYSLNMYQSYKSFIKEIKIIDNYTIDITTNDLYPGFLQRLAHTFLIFPIEQKYENNISSPIGTGPYKFVEYIENNYTKIEIYEDYWGEKPEVDTVIFKYFEDQQKRINDLISGKIDIADYNIDVNIDILNNESKINIEKFPPLSNYQIGFDMRINNSSGFPDGENPTSDVRVRKAFYHAIDIEPLINGPFRGYAKPTSQLLTQYIFGYNPNIKRLSYNTTKAKELLNESGYGNGFEIEMDCITVGYDYNKINCELIKDQLSKVGIEIKLNYLSMDEFNKKVIFDKNTSLWLVGWSPVSFDGGFIYDIFIRTVGENIIGFQNSGYYSNTRVDELGFQASIEMNPNIRSKLLQEGFQIAHEIDIFCIPLFSQELLILTSDNVKFKTRADLRFIASEIEVL